MNQISLALITRVPGSASFASMIILLARCSAGVIMVFPSRLGSTFDSGTKVAAAMRSARRKSLRRPTNNDGLKIVSDRNPRETRFR
jgi:hypothetical protein